MVAAINHGISLRMNDIPAELRLGVLVLKWPEDNIRPPFPNVVHLSVDAKGFYLICHNKHVKTIECFDLALIHDTRTGPAVSLPSDAKECSEMDYDNLGVSLSSKWLTIYYGNSFVPSQEFRTVHFSFGSPDLAQKWATLLFKYGHNQWLKNLSGLECLEKFHSRIVRGLIDPDRQTISVQRLIEFLCENARDKAKKRKIREALAAANLPHNIDAIILPTQLTFDVFFRFYMCLMDRQEIDTLFKAVVLDHSEGAIRVLGLDVDTASRAFVVFEFALIAAALAQHTQQKQHLSWKEMRDFVKQQDGVDSYLSGTDHYEQKARALIAEYSQHAGNLNNESMDKESFLRYLLSVDNLIVDPIVFDLFMDMNKSLAHYFIASSHNTYLTGGQWSGRASVEMYRQVLLAGCRCIEIDVVDSENHEPVVKHIHTPVRAIPFLTVATAIRDYAFKTSPFPVILSIENHCSPAAQAIMAKILVDVFRETLVTEPLPTHPCEQNYPLPSPNDLLYTVLIKNKKVPPPPVPKVNNQKGHTIITPSSSDPSTDISSASSPPAMSSQGSLPHLCTANRPRRDGFLWDDSSSDEEAFPNQLELLDRASCNRDVPPESKATKAMSDLVVYFVPVRFKTFAQAQELKRSYEMSSFSEDQALSLTRDFARDFLAYNQRQCSRIYPRGTRVDSKNFNPYSFWRVGCQMVALNYQTLDVHMQLNLGMFSFNNACGYIEKPAALCEPHNPLDAPAPNGPGNVDSCDIHLRVLSGQFLCETREPSFVTVQVHGTYDDSSRRREHSVRAKRWNGFQAVYDDTSVTSNDGPIHLTNISLSAMTALRFEVSSDNGTSVGQCYIPVSHLRSGYRHVVLRNKINVPVRAASLFIFVQKKMHANINLQAYANRSRVRIPKFNGSLDDLSPKVVLRHGISTVHPSTENLASDGPSIPVAKSNWYEEHVLRGSDFNDKKRLCRVSTLDDVKLDEIKQRNEMIGTKIRSISAEYKKKIEKEEVNMTIHLATQHESCPRSRSDAPNQRLLSLHAEKFRQQEQAEQKHLTKYFDEIKRKIEDDYMRQLNRMATIFKEEKSRVGRDVQHETLPEAKPNKRPESSWKILPTLTGKSTKTLNDHGASTIRKLEMMYEEAKDTLHENYEASLEQLEQRRRLERQTCAEKYRIRLEELEAKLQRQISRSEHDVLRVHSPSARQAGAANSLPSLGNRSSPPCRRQTMD